jgi:cyclic pyranopterin phosphate synthase
VLGRIVSNLAQQPSGPYRIFPVYSLPVFQQQRLPDRALLATAPPTAVLPRSVRLSLTDRCDLACIYCRPHRHDGYTETRLELSDWKRMVEGLVLAGVRRVRLTGGEPLLHPGVVDVIVHLSTLGLGDIALTTNATCLARLARPLRDAGLRRINISLDTLDEQRFFRMTRGGRLSQVLEGIREACAVGFDEIKLNCVVVRGENDLELERLARWSWGQQIVPRFLEVMMIGEGASLADRVVTAAEMRRSLAPLLEDETPRAEPDRGPARYVRARHNPLFKVGFISGTSDTFCAGCDRLRVTSDGTLRPCLSTNVGLSASSAARTGDPHAIAAKVAEAWTLKPDGETWKGCTEATARDVSMRAIGG